MRNDIFIDVTADGVNVVRASVKLFCFYLSERETESEHALSSCRGLCEFLYNARCTCSENAPSLEASYACTAWGEKNTVVRRYETRNSPKS